MKQRGERGASRRIAAIWPKMKEEIKVDGYPFSHS